MLEGLGEEAAVRVEEGAALVAVFRDDGLRTSGRRPCEWKARLARHGSAFWPLVAWGVWGLQMVCGSRGRYRDLKLSIEATSLFFKCLVLIFCPFDSQGFGASFGGGFCFATVPASFGVALSFGGCLRCI